MLTSSGSTLSPHLGQASLVCLLNSFLGLASSEGHSYTHGIHASTRTHTHAHTHICMHAHTFTHAQVCTEMQAHAHTSICTHACKHAPHTHMHSHAHTAWPWLLTGAPLSRGSLCWGTRPLLTTENGTQPPGSGTCYLSECGCPLRAPTTAFLPLLWPPKASLPSVTPILSLFRGLSYKPRCLRVASAPWYP